MKQGYIYIITNKVHTVLYIGVTSDIVKRIYQHKNKLIDGFSNKYNLDKLVYYECSECIESAIAREKQLKKKSRIYKEELISSVNPEWNDLYDSIK